MPKILAIDDINDNLITLKAIIDDAFPGSFVFTALNGPKGIELAVANDPDVILLDIIMPEMDGFEVCRLLKLEERTRDIPVVFLTALKGDKENRIKALEVGAEGFLSKPIDEIELIAQVKAMVKIKAASEQKRNEKEQLEKLVEERTSSLQNELEERKKAEKSLLESEERFQLLFNKAPLGYQSLDIDGHFIEVNQQWLETLGYTREEVIGKWFGDFLSPSFQDGFRNRFPIFKAQGFIHSEFEMVHKNGEILFIAFEGKIGYDIQGEFKQTHCILQDITQSKKAINALKESEERFKHIFESANVGKSITLPTGEIDVNQAFCDMLGYTKEELENKKWQDITPVEDIDFTQKIVNSLLKGEKNSARFNKRYLHKNGSIVWADVSVAILHDQHGKTLHFITTVIDITEQKRAKELLRESEEKHRTLFEQASDGIFIADQQGNYIDVNSSGCAMLGYSREEIVKFNIRDIVTAENLINNELKLDELKSGGIILAERELRCKDGSIIPVEISGKIMPDGRFQGIVRNISERIKAEQALQKSEAQFREFFEKAADAIFIAEIESGIIVDANVAASRLMLRPHNELVGIHQTELHPQVKKNDTNDSFKKHKELVKQNLSSFVLENTVVRADGIEIPVEILASEVDYHGKRCLLGTFRDISERKRANEALKNSLSLTEATLESIHNGILVDDHKGRMIKTNSRFAEMWRIPEPIIASGDDKILIKSILDQLINPDEYISKVMELYAKPESESTDLVYFKDGRIFERVSKPMIIEDMPKGRIWSFLDITERRRAENELRENVARLELAMSTANMAWWEMDMTTGYVTFERRKAEMLGYAPEKFKHYTDFTALVHPEDHERTMNAMRLLLKGSLDKYEVEYRIKKISGDYIWFYDIGSVIKRDLEGKPLIISGLVLNISERKQADEELQKSYNMLEKLADQVPGVVYQYRLYPDGRTAFPFSSPGMYNIYELTPDEVREDASPVLTRIHPDDADYIVEAIAESARNQTIYHSEFRVILPKQGLRWRMSDAKPELLEDGSTLWHGIITDITERKQNEETLLERKQLFKGLFDASPDAILLMETNHPTISWPIVDCNEAACWMNGYTREEIICQSIDLLHATKGIPEERDIYYNDLKREGILRREHIHRHKDGHIFPIESSTTIVTVGGHEMILGIDRDITERKQAEAELIQAKEKAQESDRLKSAFLANMSHEIRTPLNSIIGFSDLLFDSEFDEEQKKSFAENISLSGNGLLAIISDIMDLSKIETGQVHVNKSKFSFNRIVSDIHRENSFKASKKGIELRIDPLNPEDILIESDQDKLRQVLINLVTNALKFTESGFVEMGIRDRGDCVYFQVKDTGIGIPAEYHVKVFERFRQVESAKSRKYGGNGLGLAISKSLVEMLGGKIGIESVEGSGSTFYFTIPK